MVGVTAVLAKIFLFGKKKKSSPVTLSNPDVKVPLKLIDKEVWHISVSKQPSFFVLQRCISAEQF